MVVVVMDVLLLVVVVENRLDRERELRELRYPGMVIVWVELGLRAGVRGVVVMALSCK